MLRTPAKIIAVLLHPMLMPLIATWLLFNTGSYLSFTTAPVLQKIVYGIIFISTLLLPSLTSMMMLKKGMISSLEMEERKERNLPFIATIICFCAGIFLLFKLPVPRIFGLILTGGMLAVLFSFLVNLKWKISIHMVGIGGLMGVMSGYAMLFNVNMILPLMILAVLAGLLGTARLIRESHTPSQIYAGFICGFLIEFFYIRIIIGFLLFR